MATHTNFLTVAQYAKHHGLSRQVVYHWLRTGRLPGARRGGRWVVLRALELPPPTGIPGNPLFSNSDYQRELAQRPRRPRRIRA
jgi:predicted DNA-binding transcriptional regulator AlpA